MGEAYRCSSSHAKARDRADAAEGCTAWYIIARGDDERAPPGRGGSYLVHPCAGARDQLAGHSSGLFRFILARVGERQQPLPLGLVSQVHSRAGARCDGAERSLHRSGVILARGEGPTRSHERAARPVHPRVGRGVLVFELETVPDGASSRGGEVSLGSMPAPNIRGHPHAGVRFNRQPCEVITSRDHPRSGRGWIRPRFGKPA
jgi:hypothetical protein